MIAVKKRYRPMPAGLRSAGAKAKQRQLMQEGNNHEASGYYYAHDTVKAELFQQYHNKCCYCERVMEESGDRRVKHYRPKKARKEKDKHPGYYWLSYDWSNLLLACNTCNTKKSNHFPVTGQRVRHPPALKRDWPAQSRAMRREKPLILNPETDNPTEHIGFSADGGIFPLNASAKGKATIAICRLDREALVIQGRKKIVDQFRDELKDQAFLLLRQAKQGRHTNREDFQAALDLAFQSIANKIKAAQQPEHPFSRVAWYINNDPESFIFAGIPAGEPRKVVRLAFQRLGMI